MYLLSFFVMLVSFLLPVNTFASSKKTLYVLTKITASGKDNMGNYDYKIKMSDKYTYTSKGLLKTSKYSYDNSDGSGYEKISYIYDDNGILKKGKIKSFVQGNKTTFKQTFRHNTRNQIYQMTYGMRTIGLQYDKKGQCIAADNYRLSYDANGRITKTTVYEDGEVGGNITYKYDSKGNLIEDMFSENGSSIKYTNRYKSGRLSKKILSEKSQYNNKKVTYKYYYKKIKVPSSYLNRVKRQQNWLCLNMDPIEPGYRGLPFAAVCGK